MFRACHWLIQNRCLLGHHLPLATRGIDSNCSATFHILNQTASSRLMIQELILHAITPLLSCVISQSTVVDALTDVKVSIQMTGSLNQDAIAVEFSKPQL